MTSTTVMKTFPKKKNAPLRPTCSSRATSTPRSSPSRARASRTPPPASFARNALPHVVFGRTAVHGFRKYLYYWAIQHFLKESPNVDVHIVTQHSERE